MTITHEQSLITVSHPCNPFINKNPPYPCTDESPAPPSPCPGNHSIGAWNVCGWSLDPANKLRSNVLKALELDIVCLSETFLRDERSINIEGYSWFRNNRQSISKRALWESGGVGVLVKQSVLNQYDVATVTDKYEGILWVQLISKTSKKQIGICVCYLPPAGSSRGDQSQEFFDTLKALVIDNYHLGPFLLCGDLNARCGTLEDVPNQKIPTRIPIDKVSNQRGKELVEILHTLELCVLNGRFGRTKDNFTSVSTRGVAVVGCPTSVPWRPDTWCTAARERKRSKAEIRLGEREVCPGVCCSQEERTAGKTTESSLVLIWVNLCKTTFSELIKMVWMRGKWIILTSNLKSLHFLFRCQVQPNLWQYLLKAYTAHTGSSPRWYQPECRVQSYVVQWSASWSCSPPCWQMWAGYSHTAPETRTEQVQLIHTSSSPVPVPDHYNNSGLGMRLAAHWNGM